MENNNETNGRPGMKEFLGKYGAYLIIMVCIAAAAIASVFLFPGKSEDDTAKLPDQTERKGSVEVTPYTRPVSGSKDQSINDVQDPVTGKHERTTKGTPAADADLTPVPDFTAAPKESDAPSQSLLDPPVNGEITWDYAMNELIYSATLDQWTTHCGVDIACRQGDPVRAVADGTVEKVYTDDAYGVTVVIKHKNSHRSVYSNLAQDDKLVTVGMSVSANQVIASCGNTAKFECADKSHIHFEYQVNGKSVDPHGYVRLKAADN